MRDASRYSPLDTRPTLPLFSSENHVHVTYCVAGVKTFTRAPVVPRTSPLVPFLFSSLRDCLLLRDVTNGRELLSVEGFGYVCEDQATGSLRGPLGGCESLQRRWNR